jgi:methylated-DNA-[protein]-cysteine S-methyltransferase
MIYKSYYQSPIGKLLLASKENKLIGLWIEGQKYYLGNLKEELQENNTEEILIKTKKWLDRYFDDKKPEISELELDPIGSEFRKNVWKLLCKIPYGKITTYKSIAENVAKIMNRKQMSAQAIGGAVGHNPISIIIPCHRVIGTDGSLTGYAGGIDKKIKLLKLEKVDLKDIKV